MCTSSVIAAQVPGGEKGWAPSLSPDTGTQLQDTSGHRNPVARTESEIDNIIINTETFLGWKIL